MLEQFEQQVVESVVNTLETMAFISPLPSAELLCGPEPVVVEVEFSGEICGRLELLTDASLGRVISGNILGLPVGDPSTIKHAADGLRELANVACGSFLPTLVEQSGRRVQLGLPKVCELSREAWEQQLAGGGYRLDAEGSPLVVRLREAA